MSRFVKGDNVVLLKDFEPYFGVIIPAGTNGEIVSLLSGRPTFYRVKFIGYGWYDVRNDILSIYRSEAFNISSSIKDVLYKDPVTIIS